MEFMDVQTLVKSIVSKFIDCFERLRGMGIVSEKALERYSEHNIHSFFQYCLVTASQHLDLLGIPEYRLRLSKPIDKYSLDPRLGKKRIKTLRVDIGFLKGSKLIGIGEVYTPDEIHGCLPSKELEIAWVSPYHKLTHIVEHEKHVKFLILVIGLWTLPPWRDTKKRTEQEWYTCWRKLVELISSKGPVRAVYIIKGLNNIEAALE